MADVKEVVWKAIPGTSQEMALACRCDSILLCGTRGSGKTSTQLARFRAYVGRGYGSFLRGILFDVAYKDLDDIVAQSKRMFLAFEDGAKFLSASSQYKWVWPTGEELLFRTGEDEEDYWAFHGQEFPIIMANEISKLATPVFLDMMMSCNRSSFKPEMHSPVDMHSGERRILPPIPLELVCTTNPYGVGRAWVKKRYIDPAPYGGIVSRKIEIISPQTKKLAVVEKTQVTIFSSYVENIYLPDAYIAQLHQETDKNKRKAWLGGRWDISAGGAFDDLWEDTVHILERFPIPKAWILDRAFDWGSTHPFSVGWWAEANGEEVKMPNGRPVLHQGRVFAPATGTLIMFAEWYGSEEKDWGSNKGIKMSSGDIAVGILAAEKAMSDAKLISSRVFPGPADNQIRNVNDSGSETIEKKMMDKGVEWESSDKSPGSRINGYQLFRERLEAATRQEGPGIYFMRNCKAAIELIPSLPVHPTIPEDTHHLAEDHCLHGDTLVDTESGQVKIRHLVGTEAWVYSTERRLVPYLNCRLTQEHVGIYRITFSNGAQVLCTIQHRFLAVTGEWVKTYDLARSTGPFGHRITCTAQDYRVAGVYVMEVMKLGFSDVYCLDVIDELHGFSIEGGIISHNCWDSTRYRILKSNNRIATNVSVRTAS